MTDEQIGMSMDSANACIALREQVKFRNGVYGAEGIASIDLVIKELIRLDGQATKYHGMFMSISEELKQAYETLDGLADDTAE